MTAGPADHFIQDGLARVVSMARLRNQDWWLSVVLAVFLSAVLLSATPDRHSTGAPPTPTIGFGNARNSPGHNDLFEMPTVERSGQGSRQPWEFPEIATINQALFNLAMLLGTQAIFLCCLLLARIFLTRDAWGSLD